MVSTKNKVFAISLLALAALAGCGGGGDSSTPVTAAPAPIPAAEGVFGGTLTGSTSRAFNLLVLENGDFWTLYGTQTANVFGIAGFVQGTGTSNNGNFTSSNAKDFGFSPAVSNTVNATYDPTTKTISGKAVAGTSTVTFTGGPVAGSLYDYNSPSSLTTIAGAWSTTSLTGDGVAINIASSGSFTALSSLGCAFSGTVTPRASGKNVFNVALTFGAAPCALAGQSASGIALAYPVSGGKTQLLVAATDTTRNYGAAVFGTR